MLALAMAVFGCRPLNCRELVFAPEERKLDADIAVPKCSYAFTAGESQTVRLLHFSNYLTQKSFYRFEVEKLKKGIRWDEVSFTNKIRYQWKLRRFLLRYYDLNALLFRVRRKIRKKMKRV